jgi:hypothetical protein
MKREIYYEISLQIITLIIEFDLFVIIHLLTKTINFRK